MFVGRGPLPRPQSPQLPSALSNSAPVARRAHAAFRIAVPGLRVLRSREQRLGSGIVSDSPSGASPSALVSAYRPLYPLSFSYCCERGAESPPPWLLDTAGAAELDPYKKSSMLSSGRSSSCGFYIVGSTGPCYQKLAGAGSPACSSSP